MCKVSADNTTKIALHHAPQRQQSRRRQYPASVLIVILVWHAKKGFQHLFAAMHAPTKATAATTLWPTKSIKLC
jgi:hypothetical protein